MICHYWFFNHGFKFEYSTCKGCHDLRMLCLNFIDFALITVKDADYCCIIHGITKSESISLLKNSMLHDLGYT